jgi:hypothetical protein
MIRLVPILFLGCLSAFCGEIEGVNGILSVTPFSTATSSCFAQTRPAPAGQADCKHSSQAKPIPASPAPAKEDTLRVMFWNVENFFREGEFEGHNWSKRRFYSKCAAVAKIILLAGDYFGGLPDIVGFAEIGSIDVLKALIYTTPLRKADYSIVHYDSPDSRGIDCALLYRRTRFRLLSSKPCHLYDNAGHIIPTRDILLALLEQRNENSMTNEGKTSNIPLAILVNHHPSKLGKGSQGKRQTAMDRLRFLVDSLKAEGIGQIMAIGDFNEEVKSPANLQADRGKEPQDDNGRKAWPKIFATPGTIKFQGRWEKIDGCPILEGLEGREYIMALPQLSVKDSYGGVKPRRIFSGPRYLAGVSDHYPVFYLISRAPSLTTTSYTMGSWPNFAAYSFFAASINGW